MNTTENVGRECHAVAELFPLLSGAAFDELVADIKKHGLRQPILCDAEGRIVDGRNRYRACQAAGVEPRFETWQGEGSAAELVLSLNLKRRHLDESQRALVGARLAMMLHVESAKRNRLPREQRANLPSAPYGNSRSHAAAMVNVSPRLITSAIKLLREGRPELITDVESGRVAVSAAAGGARKLARPARDLRERQTPERGGHYGILRPSAPGVAPLRIPGEDPVVLLWVTASRQTAAVAALKARGFRYKPSIGYCLGNV